MDRTLCSLAWFHLLSFLTQIRWAAPWSLGEHLAHTQPPPRKAAAQVPLSTHSRSSQGLGGTLASPCLARSVSQENEVSVVASWKGLDRPDLDNMSGRMWLKRGQGGTLLIDVGTLGAHQGQASEQLAANSAMWMKMTWAGKQRAVCCFKHESQVGVPEDRCLWLSFWDNP